ncbi:hypothetical protein [[Eubacterium] cellulosolvens]
MRVNEHKVDNRMIPRKLNFSSNWQWQKKFITTGIIILMLLVSMSLIVPVTVGTGELTPRTGAESNQPATGYSEGNETFEIYNETGVHDTTFDTGEIVNIRVTSDVVNWLPTGPQRRNLFEVRSYYGNLIAQGAFTQQAGGPPYVYDATFTAPITADHYLVTVDIRDSSQQGRDRFRTSDIIQVGTGATPSKLMETYSDSTATTLDWIFANGDIVYVKVYTPNTISPSDSTIEFADYKGNSAQINIENLQNPTPIFNENYSIIALDLYKDLDVTQFPDHYLKGGYWYTISLNLRDLADGQMATDWAVQIQMLPPPHITNTYCDPTSVMIIGSDSTTIYVEFTDEDATGVNEFKITMKVNSPYLIVIVLVNNGTNGQNGLTITSLGGNRYRASYTWNPSDGLAGGDFDLHAEVYDGQNGLDIDGFNNNRGEVTLLAQGGPPIIANGNITCTPARVNKMDNENVNFYGYFTDTNDQIGVNDFRVTIKIRDAANTEIIIAENKRLAEYGDVAGSGMLMIIEPSNNLYQAAISWNPEITVPVGKYDILFSVTTIYGTGTDGYGNNQDELEIYSTGYSPELTVGDTACIPSSVDIIGNKQTMIYCEFLDSDNPLPTAFCVTFKLRPPNNRISEEITLVDNKASGGSGEFGNNVKIEQSGTNYVASYYWDPPESVDIGKYDLYFMVRDEYNNTIEDPYTQNQDELELISSVIPPSISPGNTKCVPSSVNKVGAGVTKIYCEFIDSTYTDVNDFNVTFKLRDPYGNEIVLVDDKVHGMSGEDANQTGEVEITYSGTVFTAWYEWDPPITVDAGQYDLFFGVKNRDGGFARDGFDNNRDELTIETSGNAPVITKTDCFPPTISISDSDSTSIYAEFTDIDNPQISDFLITVKVRDPEDNEIVIVQDKPHEGVSEFGDLVNIIVSGTGYMASIDWDPADGTMPGKYDLYFSVKDETIAEAVDNYYNNQDELELTLGQVTPAEPTLKPGVPKEEENVYNFTVTYLDPNNEPPNEDGVILLLDEESLKMKEVDPTDYDYTDGKDYYYTVELEDDNVDFNYKVTNTNGEGVESEKIPLSEATDDKSSEESADYTLLIAGIVVAVIVIILFLLLFLINKKKAKETPTKPSQERIILPEGPDGELTTETVPPPPADAALGPTESGAEPAPGAELGTNETVPAEAGETAGAGEGPTGENEPASTEPEPELEPDAEAPSLEEQPPESEMPPETSLDMEPAPMEEPSTESPAPVAKPAAPGAGTKDAGTPPAAPATPAQDKPKGSKNDDAWKILDD